MKITLYVFALIWLLVGLLLLGLAIDQELLSILPTEADSADGPKSHHTAADLGGVLPFGIALGWLLVFFMPALLLAALGALLARLDKIHHTLLRGGNAPEPEVAPRKKPTTKKIEPHIGAV